MLILAVAEPHKYWLNQRFADFDDMLPSLDAVLESFYQDDSPIVAKPSYHEDDSVTRTLGNFRLCQVIVDHIQARRYTRLERSQSHNNIRS